MPVCGTLFKAVALCCQLGMRMTHTNLGMLCLLILVPCSWGTQQLFCPGTDGDFWATWHIWNIFLTHWAGIHCQISTGPVPHSLSPTVGVVVSTSFDCGKMGSLTFLLFCWVQKRHLVSIHITFDKSPKPKWMLLIKNCKEKTCWELLSVFNTYQVLKQGRGRRVSALG